MGKRQRRPDDGQPRWVRLLINLAGVAVIAHETIVQESSVRWPLLVVAVVMMGLASADLLDRYLPEPRRSKEDEA